jgi:hypothetical protein
MFWSRMSLVILEQYAEARYGPVLLVGVLLVVLSVKTRSTHVMCLGGLLVLLALLR